MSAPACSATSSVSRVDRPQILTSRDMFQDTGWGGDARPESDGPRSTTSRPACLAHWAHIRHLATGPEGVAGRPERTQPRRADRPVAPAPAAHRPHAGAPRAATG